MYVTSVTLSKFSNKLENLFNNYFSITTHKLGEEIHILESDPLTHDPFEPYMIIATRDAQGPVLVGILCGSTSGKYAYGIKLLILAKEQNITIINGTKTTPLILKSSYKILRYNFIPMVANPKSKPNIQLIQNKISL